MYQVASVESQLVADTAEAAASFNVLLASKCFLPNPLTFTGAGTPLGQPAASLIPPLSDDMGHKRAGISHTSPRIANSR